MRTRADGTEANYYVLMFNLSAALWAAGLGETAADTLMAMVPADLATKQQVTWPHFPAPAERGAGGLLWE